jgi:hypothetical protein
MRIQLITVKFYQYGSPEAAARFVEILRMIAGWHNWKFSHEGTNEITTPDEAQHAGIEIT